MVLLGRTIQRKKVIVLDIAGGLISLLATVKSEDLTPIHPFSNRLKEKGVVLRAADFRDISELTSPPPRRV